MFAWILERDPLHTTAMEGQAHLYRHADLPDDAIRMYRKALEIKPGDVSITTNLAFALRDYGQRDEALALLRGIVETAPTWAGPRSALIFTMLMDPRIDQRELEAEEERWNHFHAEPLATERLPHTNDRTPERRLKIGYVSADFCHHPVGHFMAPILAHHDRSQVEIFCYSVARQSDAITSSLRSTVDHWRHAFAMDDRALAALVRRDGIDILVDLGMHCVDNRLPAFARKLAPVQVTYLAYCGGAGLHTMDYRLTDRHIDPPPQPGDARGIAEEAARTFERKLRIETYWCFTPPAKACEVTPLPMKLLGRVTFGSFNYFSKINPAVLDRWARLLRDLPASRLVLHVPGKSLWAKVHADFERAGVSPDRIELAPRVGEEKYFQQYGTVDIALDTFPFTGGTTTCDALWMGVPVVTLAGQTTISRGSTSILSTIGLPELIAHSPEEYHRIVRDLATNMNRLDALRRTMRQRMQESPLMDASRFTRSLEQAYRTAWQTWCEKGRE